MRHRGELGSRLWDGAHGLTARYGGTTRLLANNGSPSIYSAESRCERSGAIRSRSPSPPTAARGRRSRTWHARASPAAREHAGSSRRRHALGHRAQPGLTERSRRHPTIGREANADDRRGPAVRALSAGVNAIAMRFARGLNAVMGKTGKVFADRYHAHVPRTPREVRNAVAYVRQLREPCAPPG